MKTTQYTLKNILYLLIIFTVIYLVIVLSNLKCNPEPTEIKIIKTTIKKHIAKRNLVPVDTIFPDPEIIYKIKYLDTLYLFIYDTVYTVSDIVIDYFIKYNLKDTIKLDTVGMVYLNDSISQNCLYYRGIDYEIHSYTKLIQDKKHFKAFLGTYYIHNAVFNSIGAEMSVNVKKNMFTVGIGTNKTYLFNYKRLIFEK